MLRINNKGCLIFAVIGFIFLYKACSFESDFEDALKENGYNIIDKESIKAEEKRFEDLPVVKGIILDKDSVITPFSKKSANVCFMNLGVTTEHTRSRRGKNDISDRRYTTTDYARKSTLYNKQQIILLINGKKYFIKSKKIILANVNYDNEKKQIGIVSGGFSTKEDFDKLFFLKGYEYYRKEYNISKQQEKEYLENIKILCSFRDEYDLINCYYFSRFDRENTPDNCDLIYKNYHFKEIIYKTGDTISFKGKIVNNEVVPLY